MLLESRDDTGLPEVSFLIQINKISSAKYDHGSINAANRFREVRMTIDWINFTPWLSLAGGLVIGAAAAMLLLLNGRIAGISGILGGLLERPSGDIGWRIAFLAGLLAAPLLYRVIAGLPAIAIEAGGGRLIVAGLLVGLGTRLGSGCTSGHGVCGLALGSRRSMAATAIFMLAGIGSVYVVRHMLGA